MSQRPKILATVPIWQDIYIDHYKFKFATEFMAWIIDNAVERFRAKGYDVVYLRGADAVRENYERVISGEKFALHIHGGHGACNALAQDGARALICSPKRGWCRSERLSFTDISRQCAPVNYESRKNARICYDLACASGRWLAEDCVSAGVEGYIAWDDVIAFHYAKDLTWKWIDDMVLELYLAVVDALLAGKTLAEAVEYSKALHKEKYDYIKQKAPWWLAPYLTMVADNWKYLIVKGNANIKLEPVYEPPPPPPPPETELVEVPPLEIPRPPSGIFGLFFLASWLYDCFVSVGNWARRTAKWLTDKASGLTDFLFRRTQGVVEEKTRQILSPIYEVKGRIDYVSRQFDKLKSD